MVFFLSSCFYLLAICLCLFSIFAGSDDSGGWCQGCALTWHEACVATAAGGFLTTRVSIRYLGFGLIGLGL